MLIRPNVTIMVTTKTKTTTTTMMTDTRIRMGIMDTRMR